MNRLPHHNAPWCTAPGGAGSVAHAPAGISGLLICLLVALCGCASLSPWETPAEGPAASTAPARAITLTYRTDSGRLNRQAAGRDGVAPASHQQPRQPAHASATAVPQFTTSTLVIEHPHPDGRPGLARVTARFESRNDADTPETLWSTIAGSSADQDSFRPRFREVWQTEIHAWQLASLLEELKQRDYFRRVKVVGCEAHVATEIDGSSMDKEFPAIAELDTLLMTIRSNGRRTNSSKAQPASPPSLLE